MGAGQDWDHCRRGNLRMLLGREGVWGEALEQTGHRSGCFFQQLSCWVNVCGAREHGGLGRRDQRPPASQREKAQTPTLPAAMASLPVAANWTNGGTAGADTGNLSALTQWT